MSYVTVGGRIYTAFDKTDTCLRGLNVTGKDMIEAQASTGVRDVAWLRLSSPIVIQVWFRICGSIKGQIAESITIRRGL